MERDRYWSGGGKSTKKGVNREKGGKIWRLIQEEKAKKKGQGSKKKTWSSSRCGRLKAAGKLVGTETGKRGTTLYKRSEKGMGRKIDPRQLRSKQRGDRKYKRDR